MDKKLASQPNWSKLVAQGRAKAIGVPWSEEELKARYDEGIPADYVRKGILTKKEYEKAVGEEKKEVEQQEVRKASTPKKEENKGLSSYDDLSWASLKSLAAKRGITKKKKEGMLKALRSQDKTKENPFSLSKISKMSTKKLIEKANEELGIDVNAAMPRPDIVDAVLTESAKKMSEGKVDKNDKDKK